jgi:hypothetical protein
MEPIRRYLPKAEARALLDEFTSVSEDALANQGAKRASGGRTASENRLTLVR